MHDQLRHLTERVGALELAFEGSGGRLATKRDLDEMEQRLMTAISDFAAKVDTAFASIHTAVDGIVTDVNWLKSEITRLQNTQGQITPEDQAILDGLESRAGALVTKVQALDAATETPPSP